MNELALFAGAGGGILGGKLLGWQTVCAVERDAYAAQVLAQRQNDGILETFPIWSDVSSFDGKPWRGIVDVVSGGFPCQDISAAGKGAGIEGKRSGLWSEFKRIICEVRPRFAWVENSPMLTSRGLGVVLGDLAEMGFDAKWCVLGISDIGATHKRKRIWILADSNAEGVSRQSPGFSVNEIIQSAPELRWLPSENSLRDSIKAWDAIGRPRGDVESPLRRANDGLAGWDDRLRAIGNGQVPIVVATAWRILSGGKT